ncbi:MAG: PFL family protein [Firmicutes bacterium]|nr:PFL family protein [Bacillota bacterium]
MIETGEIIQTMRMIREENFDIRTITLGLNLLDCNGPDAEATARRCYDKVCRYGERLVAVGEEIETEYGVPIVNKRVSVTPVALLGLDDPTPVARALDRAAARIGVNFLGGYSALMQKGATAADLKLIESIPEVLAGTERLCASVNLGSTRAGINMDAVAQMGRIICRTAELTREQDALGCAKLVVFCNAVEDNPFMAGAFCGPGEPECAINVGVSGPGVVQRALKEIPGQPFEVVAETIKRMAFKITRVGELVAHEASRRLNIPYGIVDLSLAPTPARGDSVAHILMEMGLEMAGAPGTTAALALLNDAVKKGGVLASGNVGGLSGAFIPVSEDIGMIESVTAGALTLEKLEAMTCVCSVGLDMIAIPGDVSPETVSGVIADEMAIGMINNKTTAVRVIPAIGKKAGDTVSFGGLLGHAPVMPVNTFSCRDFIARGGRFPAPLNSLKN